MWRGEIIDLSRDPPSIVPDETSDEFVRGVIDGRNEHWRILVHTDELLVMLATGRYGPDKRLVIGRRV